MAALLSPELIKITDFFAFPGRIVEAGPFGSGHINDTILIRCDRGGKEDKYVLQKLNRYVFHHPDELMENTVGVTEFLKKKVAAAGGDPDREVLNVVSAPNGAVFYVDDAGDYWRVTKFVENTTSFDAVRSPEDFYKCGLAFGRFQSMLSDYPAETLHSTIPHFHDTRFRYENFARVAEADPVSRVKDAQADVDFILSRRDLAYYAMDSYDRGELPLRVTHNDTKINNLLVDVSTGMPVCVIDLDTVMPGFAMNDFGDAIRFGASTAAEDEPDPEKVFMDLTLYEHYTRGFVEGCRGKLTEHELETLPRGALCITYEQALRFLVDYLEGDVYFKTAYPEHNLVRARTQIKLVKEQEKHWDEIQAIIRKYI